MRKRLFTSIAAAVVATATAHAAELRPEQDYAKSNPALWAAAQKYFPATESAAPAARLARLTRDQLDATVASLLPGYRLPSVKQAMPRDPRETNYEYADLLALNAANIDALTGWIGAVAAAVRAKPSAVVDCPKEDAACLTAAVRRFVATAFRGDVADTTIDRHTRFFLDNAKTAGVAQATGDLVEVVLNSPSFLFRKELPVNRSGRLSPAQHLQALTYTLADAPPERVGLSSANPLAFMQTPDDLRTTAGGIAASTDGRDKLVRFFKSWLEIREPGEFTISKETFPEFDPGLTGAMLQEVDRFLRAELSGPAPKLKNITQSTRAFSSPAMQKVYGSRQGADKAGDSNQRFGIFTQPAVLASHSGPTNTRPVKRGVFWVRKVMCMELEPPPKDLHIESYDSVQTTERKRIEMSTKRAACAGCHKVINPLGFFQERYDAIGRWRDKDNGFPVDASIAIDFLDEGKSKATEPVEAVRILTASAMFKQCFVRQAFRFYMGRAEEPGDDPVLRRMFLAFADNDDQDLLSLVGELASSDRISRRQ